MPILFVIDPICMWHELLLKQFLYVHYVETYKKNLVKTCAFINAWSC